MSNLFFKKDVHKSIEGLLYGLFVYQYLLDTSTFGLLLRCLVQEQVLSIKSKAPTLRVALYVVLAAGFLAFLRHLHPPERYAVIIDFIGNLRTPSQTFIYWLDAVILVLQVTEALIVFKVIKAEDTPARSTTPPRISSAAQPPRTLSPNSSSSSSTPGTRSGGGAGSSSASAMPALVNHASASSSNPPPPPTEYTPLRNNNSSNQQAEDLDDMHPEYYEDEEEVRFSTDLDRHQQQQQRSQSSSQGGPSIQRSRPSGTSSNRRRRRSDTDDSSEDASSEDEDEGDLLGDDYEEVLEQETFVFQLRFQDLVSYIFSSQEVLTMPDSRTLTGVAGGVVNGGGQSGSGGGGAQQQQELPV